VALAAIGAVTLLWVLLNLRGPAGFWAMLELYWFGRQPAGLMYYHTWMHAFHTFAIPLNVGVAIVVYEATVEWRKAALRAWRTSFMKCAECGYDLTGNLSGRCPECGTQLPSKAPASPTDRHAR
jgi:rRNA maturation protein Nop10